MKQLHALCLACHTVQVVADEEKPQFVISCASCHKTLSVRALECGVYEVGMYSAPVVVPTATPRYDDYC